MTHRCRMPLLILLIAAVAHLTACDSSQTKPPPDIPAPVTPEQIAELESKMKVKLPKSSKPIGIVSRSAGQESVLCAKVEIDAKDLKGFLDASPWRGAAMKTDRRYSGGVAMPTWWDPDAPQKYQSAMIDKGGHELFSILIGLDNADKSVLYLFYSKS